jgi:hypothetical protein
LFQLLQSEVKELRERTRDLESRQRRTQAERDAARGRADQLAEQLGAACSCRGGRRLPPAPGGWAEKNSDEDSGKHSDNSLSQSEPGWLLDSAARYKAQYTVNVHFTVLALFTSPSPCMSSFILSFLFQLPTHSFPLPLPLNSPLPFHLPFLFLSLLSTFFPPSFPISFPFLSPFFTFLFSLTSPSSLLPWPFFPLSFLFFSSSFPPSFSPFYPLPFPFLSTFFSPFFYLPFPFLSSEFPLPLFFLFTFSSLCSFSYPFTLPSPPYSSFSMSPTLL